MYNTVLALPVYILLALDENALQKVIDSQGGSNSPSCSISAAEALITPTRPGPSGSTTSTSLGDSLTGAAVSRKRNGKVFLGGEIVEITPHIAG